MRRLKVPKKRLAVVGYTCLDISAEYPDDNPHPINSLKQIGPIRGFAPGGVACNAGLAAHNMGMDSLIVGLTGDDHLGHILRKLVRDISPALAQGIHPLLDGDTSYSFIKLLPDGHKYDHHSGANNHFTANLVERISADNNFAIAHCGYPGLMKSWYANDGEELANTLRQLKSNGVTTSLDMVEIDPSSEAAQINWIRWLENVLPYVDFFLPSIGEMLPIFKTMGGSYKAGIKLWHQRHDESGQRFLASWATTLLGMGANLVCFKLGPHGLFLQSTKISDHTDLSTNWDNRQLWFEPFDHIEPIYGVGAGDCACMGLLSGAMAGGAPEEAGDLARLVAWFCLNDPSPAGGILPLERMYDLREALVTVPLAPPITEDDRWNYDSDNGIWHGPHNSAVQ